MVSVVEASLVNVSLARQDILAAMADVFAKEACISMNTEIVFHAEDSCQTRMIATRTLITFPKQEMIFTGFRMRHVILDLPQRENF